MRHHFLPHIITLMLLSLFTSCAKDGEYDIPEESRLVVQAYIDSDDFPVLILTRSIPVTNDYQDLSDLSKYVERWAKITISDGEREEVMTGRIDKSYTPSYIYTNYNLRGEKGKTYTIRIHCTNGYETEAVTSIPDEQIVVERFTAEKVANSDTLYQLYVHIDTQQTTARYFKVFAQHDKERQSVLSSMFGVFTKEMIDNGRVAVNRGRTNLVKDYTPHFSINDTVVVKLSAINEEQYDYWHMFENMASLSRNPLFPTSINLPSNVPGCIGYWFGYASVSYVVPIKGVIKR